MRRCSSSLPSGMSDGAAPARPRAVRVAAATAAAAVARAVALLFVAGVRLSRRRPVADPPVLSLLRPAELSLLVRCRRRMRLERLCRPELPAARVPSPCACRCSNCATRALGRGGLLRPWCIRSSKTRTFLSKRLSISRDGRLSSGLLPGPGLATARCIARRRSPRLSGVCPTPLPILGRWSRTGLRARCPCPAPPD